MVETRGCAGRDTLIASALKRWATRNLFSCYFAGVLPPM
jgi:hypothetical protein